MYIVVWVLLGRCLGSSRNEDPGPFTCCFEGLGLVHRN